jgi:hypothetical protein
LFFYFGPAPAGGPPTGAGVAAAPTIIKVGTGGPPVRFGSVNPRSFSQ